MPEGSPARSGGQEPGPTEIAAELEGVATRMGAALKEVGEPPPRRELEGCVEVLRRDCAALRSLALIFDSRRADALAQREQELKSILLAAGESLRVMTKASRQMASTVGGQLHEIDALASLPPGDELIKRLRGAAEQMRVAAGRLGQDLDSSGAALQKSQERITTLEQELEETRRKALYDGLTRLFRRSVLDERLDAAIGSGASAGPWCFLLADIDRFKSVNDRYGHLAGDALLYKVARVIETAVRQKTGEGFLSRYGGEEFGVILSNTALPQAREVAERIRERMATMGWQYRSQEGESVIMATVSIGVSQYRDKDSAASLIGRADRALYRARNEGRNRVVVEEARSG